MNETELTEFLIRAFRLIRVQQQNIDLLWKAAVEHTLPTAVDIQKVRQRNSELLSQLDAVLVAMEHGDVGGATWS